jgi:hypothetical protein
MERDRTDVGQAPLDKQLSSTEESDTNKPIEDHSIPTPSGGINKLQSTPPAGNKPKTTKKHCYTRDPGMFWVGVATLIVVGFYAWQARHQAIETGKAANAAKESADVAKAAVKVAEETLKNNIEIARQDQRAWVGLVSIEPPTLKDESNRHVYVKNGLPAEFGVTVTNSGRSPALKFKAFINCYLQPTDKGLSPEYNVPPVRSVAVIQPQMPVKLILNPTPTIFDTTIINAIKDRTLSLYVFGQMTYEDIFKEGHHTTFCMVLTSSLETFIPCKTYNEAD